MPNPQEICVVTAGGTQYKYWKEVEVVRDMNQWTTQVTLVVAEPGGLGSWKTIRLPPGVPATVTLAGTLAASGKIEVRQVAYDGDNHTVRFIILSKNADLVKGTLDLPPGQFKGQTLQQLASAAAGKSGIGFLLQGAIAGVEKVFERVSIHWGESPFQFITRLAQMRNVHVFDDPSGSGNLIGMRGGQQSTATLQEGRNILSAELTWSVNTVIDKIIVDTDQHGNDDHWGDKARAASAKATRSGAPTGIGQIIQRIIAPHSGDVKDAQMFANHSIDLNASKEFQANVTVRGWLRDGGGIWITEVGKTIELYSPMLLPQNRATLGIQAATCRQNDQTGTTTTLTLVLPQRLGNADPIDDSGGGPNTPGDAVPFVPDDTYGIPSQPSDV